MGKLRILSGKNVCLILKLHGFIEVQQRGSHVIMQRKIENNTITVPVPNHKELKIGTPIYHCQSEIARSEFEV